MQEGAWQSDGQYRWGPGTLCDNLQKLMNQGIVAEAPRRMAGDHPRRRYCRLTAFGRRVLEQDIEQLWRVVHEANLRLRGLYRRKA